MRPKAAGGGVCQRSIRRPCVRARAGSVARSRAEEIRTAVPNRCSLELILLQRGWKFVPEVRTKIANVWGKATILLCRRGNLQKFALRGRIFKTFKQISQFFGLKTTAVKQISVSFS